MTFLKATLIDLKLQGPWLLPFFPIVWSLLWLTYGFFVCVQRETINLWLQQVVWNFCSRWTSGYGEPYDYDSIMHYSAFAFSKNKGVDKTIEPKNVNFTQIGRKANLSETDITKIKKLYKCPPYENFKNGCYNDNECGVNEHCTSTLIIQGQCRTVLADGSFCTRNEECLHTCSGGTCTSCVNHGDCKSNEFCANRFLPLVENICAGYCEELCLTSSQCGGDCPVCSWRFRCEKS